MLIKDDLFFIFQLSYAPKYSISNNRKYPHTISDLDNKWKKLIQIRTKKWIMVFRSVVTFKSITTEVVVDRSMNFGFIFGWNCRYIGQVSVSADTQEIFFIITALFWNRIPWWITVKYFLKWFNICSLVFAKPKNAHHFQYTTLWHVIWAKNSRKRNLSKLS